MKMCGDVEVKVHAVLYVVIVEFYRVTLQKDAAGTSAWEAGWNISSVCRLREKTLLQPIIEPRSSRL
jgi:hypothetical protein